MRLKQLGIWLMVFVWVGCASSGNETEELADFTAMNGNIYLFTVNRTATQPKVTSPQQELKESDYSATADGKIYAVSFSTDGSSVTLEPGTFRGEKTVVADKTIRFYTLTGGAFAGGRFEVRSSASGLEGELTIYGSGLPILSSVRGSLLPGN